MTDDRIPVAVTDSQVQGVVEPASVVIENFHTPTTITGGQMYGVVGAASVVVQQITIFDQVAEESDTEASGAPITPCPYPGLAYFGPNDFALFFGRDAAIDRLTDAVGRQSFTALVGAAGSGKSSVVLAGLAPRLHNGGGWLFSYFRIGNELDGDPFLALARALVPLYITSSDETGRLVNARKLAEKLWSGELTLRDVFADCGSRNQGSRLLLIADQFEEVFTLIADEILRDHFIDVLLAGFPDPAPGGGPDNFLFLTLRADFYGRALAYRPLADVLQGHVENLGPMKREEMRQAIERPAQNANVSFEPGLVDTLLGDVESKPGSLPLLQFALREMWGQQEKRKITRKSYDAIGGVQGALARRAEAIFAAMTDNGANERMASHFQRLFTRLVTPGEGQEDTRRIAERRELGNKEWSLAQRLASEANRLVVTSASSPLRETAEMTHEALIRNWPRLNEWINRDRAFISWQRQIRLNIDLWLADPSDDGPLLRGGMLARAEDWLASRGDDLSADERRYVEASLALRRQENAERAAARHAEIARQQELVTIAAERRRRAIGVRVFGILSGGATFTAIVLAVTLLIRAAKGQTWDLLHLSGFQIASTTTGVVIVGWTTTLLLLYWQDPGRLVRWHEKFPEPIGLEEAVKTVDKITFGAGTLLGWIAKCSILWLGTSKRALDAWVEDRADSARALFTARPTVRDRRIALNLPVKINDMRRAEPWSELKRLISGDAPMAVLVSGPGGAGKTTLACSIGNRVLGTADQLPIGSYRMLPLLVDADVPEDAAKPGGFYPYVAGLLRSALNENRRITVALAASLLRSGRVLIIVDGLSERSSTNGRAFDPQRQDFEVHRLVITSRDRVIPAGVTTVIQTETIPTGALFDFVDRYLEEMQKQGVGSWPSEDRVLYACADLKRLLGETPCTPLLASMWAKEIGAPMAGGKPRGVASLSDSYIRRLLLPASNGNETFVNQLTADATKIAERELGEQYRPGHVTRAAALEVLRSLDPAELERRFNVLEKSQILETPSQDSNIVRISPDPIAEHLVARLRTEELQGNAKAWRSFIGQVRKEGSPVGFVAALAACAEDEVHGRLVPPLIREQIKVLRDSGKDARTAA
jgi:hypothetical protein